MNTPKRVSFGSKGSMVETWIIYDEKDNQSLTQTDHAETQFQRNILLNTGQEHDNQENHHHHHTNLQYHQHNHHYQQQQHEHNNNNNEPEEDDEEEHEQEDLELELEEQSYHHEQAEQVHEQNHHQQHNNNNNNNYSQQHDHDCPPSSPALPPPAKSKELRVTFSDSPLCEARHGAEHPSSIRVSKSASSNLEVDINNLNAAFQRRPIKRSQSLESRDNPFVPGGELAIDTDDILKRATIVRDKFILDEQEKLKKAENEAALALVQQDKTDGPSEKAPESKDPVKELPKENGKLEEEKSGQLGSSPPSGAVQTGVELQDAPGKEKKKQKKKCCTIM